MSSISSSEHHMFLIPLEVSVNSGYNWGEAIKKKLKKKMSIPIIFLTSKDEEVDELLKLKLGADDFVKKSGGFSTKVLIERIRVQLRKKI